MSCLARKQHNRLVHHPGEDGRTLCGYKVRIDGLHLKVTCRPCLGKRRVKPGRPHGWRIGMPWMRHPLSGV